MAPNPSLVAYIKKQMDSGFRKQQIYDVLLNAGWYREEINQAFYEFAKQESARLAPLAPEQAPAPKSPEKTGLLWKLGTSLASPARLFDAVKEEGTEPGLRFFGVIFLIHIVVLSLFTLLLEGVLVGFLDQSPLSYILVVLPSFILESAFIIISGSFAFAGIPFAAAGVMHVFVCLSGGRKGFPQTFKAVAYSLAPALFAWIAIPIYYVLPDQFFIAADIAIVLSLIWAFCLMSMGVRKMHGLSAARTALALVVPAALVGITVFLLIPPSPMQFQEQQTISVTSYSYAYNGSFSAQITNSLDIPITVSSVAANCGEAGMFIPLESYNLTHLQPGDSIIYSAGAQKCRVMEPGEPYSITVTVRYVDGSNDIQTYSKEIAGAVPNA